MPFMLRGALVEYSSDLLGPIPNIVVFQFNPVSISRTLNLPGSNTAASDPDSARKKEAHSASASPVESFSITAQFSAAVSELCEPEYIGTALTLQTSVGFLITMVSIRLVPVIQDAAGWGLAFAMLGLGPLAGIMAMTLLYKTPEAAKMASGNR